MNSWGGPLYKQRVEELRREYVDRVNRERDAAMRAQPSKYEEMILARQEQRDG